MGEIEWDKEEFVRLDNSEKTIAILGDIWWLQVGGETERG